jgi:Domain of unknown function (DUF5071)
MKDYRHIIPQSKGDESYIEPLLNSNIDDIKPAIPELLEWLADGNWPQFGVIADYLEPHLNKIQDEIAVVLQSKDPVWKYWVLLLILNSDEVPGATIMAEVTRIAQHPQPGETDEEADEIARDILLKFAPGV